MTPQTFGRFIIHRKLPAGGMGRVYEATDGLTNQRVALKLIDRGTDSDSIQIVSAERLGVELHKRLCALDPRITSVYDSGETADYLYIVMEYIDGQDLSELSAKERIGYPFAARIAQDVLEVLAIAHNFGTSIDGREYRGIVHGDIKPRNIRLTTVGQVKVLDFGIAKAISMTRSFTHNVFGSVQYSSPERLNTGEVTVSSDLWGVAVVLFEMAARHPYFQGDSGPKLERLIRNYETLQPLPDDCPEALKHILRRALAPNPDQRYQTATEFASDLGAFRSNKVPKAALMEVEATRRTVRSEEGTQETRRGVATLEEVDDATRRTFRGPNGNPPPVEEFHSQSPSRKPPPALRSGPRWGRIGLLVFLLCGAFTGYLIAREWVTWKEASELAHDIETEHVKDLDTAWDKYQSLTKRANLSLSTWSAQEALRNRLSGDADHVLTEYRIADAPSLTEADWVRARASAAKALELAPHDRTIRSQIRDIDGQLNRIRGTARRDSKLLQQSRENFLEAAQLDPKSPDPWLGLARLYVYSLHDVDSAEDALKEAEHRHYPIGKRDTAQLADGYRDRAERTLREAQNAASRPEESRYIDLARRDFQRARQLYESIIPWGNAAASLRKTYESLAQLDDLKPPPDEEPERPESRLKRWLHKLPGLK